MRERPLRRRRQIAGLLAIACGIGGFIAQLGSIVGGEFPLTAILWCALLYLLAAASFVVWLIAHLKLERRGNLSVEKA